MSYENYYDEIISFDSLYQALRKVKRGVMWKDATARYVADGLKETFKLRQELLNGKYEIRPYHTFVVTDPKRREVMATQIRDRQFQRALCDGGLYDDMIEHFIRDNYACQQYRGMDDALERMAEQLRRYYRQHGTEGYVLKCDIKSYFASTPHHVAKAAVAKRVKDPDVCDAVFKIIDSFPGDRGIGLGSQVSQLIELCVLDDLDHFIKERLHIKTYGRYMDDFALVHESKDHLKYCWEQIVVRLGGIELLLNSKTSLFPLTQGFVWLKRRFTLTETGKVIVKVTPEAIAREKRKLRHMKAKVDAGKMDVSVPTENILSWAACAERKKYASKHFEKRRSGMKVMRGPNGTAVEQMREYFVSLYGFDPYRKPKEEKEDTDDPSGTH